MHLKLFFSILLLSSFLHTRLYALSLSFFLLHALLHACFSLIYILLPLLAYRLLLAAFFGGE